VAPLLQRMLEELRPRNFSPLARFAAISALFVISPPTFTGYAISFKPRGSSPVSAPYAALPRIWPREPDELLVHTLCADAAFSAFAQLSAADVDASHSIPAT
jgi:hypothetical protein